MILGGGGCCGRWQGGDSEQALWIRRGVHLARNKTRRTTIDVVRRVVTTLRCRRVVS
jgi:hypothetical protein